MNKLELLTYFLQVIVNLSTTATNSVLSLSYYICLPPACKDVYHFIPNGFSCSKRALLMDDLGGVFAGVL